MPSGEKVVSIRVPAPDDRFSRFELITWWDQVCLRNAHVLVVGAGALGNEIVKNCALLGVGNILIADMDRVENSNLSRSVLYRAKHQGAFKAEVACAAARDIYPDIMAQPFVGNVVHDLGLGAYLWADVVLGGLDNREARVAINAGAAFARKAWIDGAIEVLDGVCRVFVPHEGACYECTMSANDWNLLESRRSCALLSRSEMEQGKVPTTPTTASIVAGLQVQEAVKRLHGLPSLAGCGLIVSGLSADVHAVRYPRKPGCMGHETYERLERLGCGAADIAAGDLLARGRKDLGAGAVIDLSRDVVTALACDACGVSEPVFRSLGKVTEKDGRCARCGSMRAPRLLHTLGVEDGEPLDRTLAELGVPAFDVVTARAGERSVSYLLDGDAAKVLGPLPWDQGGER